MGPCLNKLTQRVFIVPLPFTTFKYPNNKTRIAKASVWKVDVLAE